MWFPIPEACGDNHRLQDINALGQENIVILFDQAKIEAYPHSVLLFVSSLVIWETWLAHSLAYVLTATVQLLETMPVPK